ncbi:histidine--tRNA ligase [Chitinophaga sp. sic0106]|uniref:histidine--tRNA ligase n=1 Tax=Chitinophaga sp. sic0106 TaxID=2854785 RepID=UPI001C458CBD|nr:histidine--tRNA ligase [Chitinophaga sp. sic0106]MBV7533342.1 histidine--tRNA ligase [Chitinophaga sp. sic0106]
MIKPSIPKGTRDFGPVIVRKRNYIFQTIRQVFELYGFQPLETPAMENLSTLTGKYGEEGDKLMFKVLDNGEIFDAASKATNNKDLVAAISEKALRYDLTIPFARYVVMNQNDLALPFKRYQMQPVWRADKPQKGRYREFYQCDADVVGSNSLVNEVELLLIYDAVFTSLGLAGVELRINNRKILSGLAEVIGKQELLTDITISIDKLDKIGAEGVRKELSDRGLSDSDINTIEKFLTIGGTNEEKLSQLAELLQTSATGLKGIEELKFVLNSGLTTFNNEPIIDVTLARGLNYYTGMIVEVKAPATVKMGSIGGGGRYDDLTGLFGLKGISGVGISFGVDRIYDVLEELNLFPETAQQSTKVIFLNLGEANAVAAFKHVQALRAKGIAAEIYPESAKMDKQMKYANKRGIPFVAIIGESELLENNVSVKNLTTGQQEKVAGADVVNYNF